MATKNSKPRSDYKIGARVKVTRRGIGISAGRTAPLHDNPASCVRVTPTGAFVSVDVGTKAAPDVREFRPVFVKAY